MRLSGKIFLKGVTASLAAVLMVLLFLEATTLFIGPIYTEKAYTTVAPTEVLIESFIYVVHTHDGDNQIIKTLTKKWSVPMRFAFFGNVPDWHRILIRRYLNLLSRLTGLEFEEVPEGSGEANYHLYYAENKEAMIQIGIELGYKKEDMKDFVQSSMCFAINRTDGPKTLTTGEMVLSGKENDRYTKECIAEEMTHALGLYGHKATYLPTIFNQQDNPEKLSINDKILIRTLYDKRIMAGMTPEQTEPIAREIIVELVAAVKERGVEALYQR